MSYIDKFGFLPLEVAFNLTDCKIYPVENFKDANSGVKKYVNTDGFIYPPLQYSVKCDPSTQKFEKIPNTERPAHLHQLPASHYIEIPNTSKNKDDLRLGISGFTIHLLGYIYGIRLQFHDWWFDGRVAYEPFKHHNIAVPKVSSAVGNF